MNSVILQLAAKYLKWLLITFAILALLRGHNQPGGGFIGGLMAGLAMIFEGFASNTEQMKEILRDKPLRLTGAGLLIIFLSFIPSLVTGNIPMTGIWMKIPIPVGGEIKLGTPLLFDAGVFLTVTGVTLLFVLSLTRKNAWR